MEESFESTLLRMSAEVNIATKLLNDANDKWNTHVKACEYHYEDSDMYDGPLCSSGKEVPHCRCNICPKLSMIEDVNKTYPKEV